MGTPPIVGLGLAELGVTPPMGFCCTAVGAATGGGFIGASDEGGAGAGCASELVPVGASVDGCVSDGAGGGTVGAPTLVPGEVMEE